jgi:hypothetical protein
VNNNTVTNCAMGLDIGSGASNIIGNNLIYNCSSNGIGISSNSNSLIYNNIIHDVGDEAFYSYYYSVHGEPQTNNHYYNNIVYNAGSGLWDSNKKPSGSEGASSNHRWYNNLFYNISSEHGAAFYFTGVLGIEFYNNTIILTSGNNPIEFTTSPGGVASSGYDVQNNIFVMTGSGLTSIISDSGSSNGSTADYNDYYNTSGGGSGPGSHSITGNPLFASSIGSNTCLSPSACAVYFGLQSTSHCIDAGDSGGNIPSTDINGNSRCDDPSVPNTGGGPFPYYDIGAYEYPCVVITPPPPPEGLSILQ